MSTNEYTFPDNKSHHSEKNNEADKIPPFFKLGGRVVLTTSIKDIIIPKDNCYQIRFTDHRHWPINICENNIGYDKIKQTFFNDNNK
jgi:hypothetical protein